MDNATPRTRLSGKATEAAVPAWGGANRIFDTSRSAEAPNIATDVSDEDWDNLFNAVKSRLRSLVHEPLAPLVLPPVAAERVHDGVLDCVGALDKLHGLLKHELALRQQLEREIFDLHATLVQARAELVSTETGKIRARHLALHDGLTALPNGQFFRNQLNHMLSPVGPHREGFAVLYLDLDGFRPINDAHGRDAGDALLRIVAARLTQAMATGDTVSRVGGDEFACLLTTLPSRAQLGQMAVALYDAVSAPVKLGPLHLTVRASIGIATGPADGTTAEALLNNADRAMHCAKRYRTGYAFFDQCTGA